MRTPQRQTNPAEHSVCSRTSPSVSQMKPAGQTLGKTVAESGHMNPGTHGLHVSALLISLYVPAEQAVGSRIPIAGQEWPNKQLQ